MCERGASHSVQATVAQQLQAASYPRHGPSPSSGAHAPTWACACGRPRSSRSHPSASRVHLWAGRTPRASPARWASAPQSQACSHHRASCAPVCAPSACCACSAPVLDPVPARCSSAPGSTPCRPRRRPPAPRAGATEACGPFPLRTKACARPRMYLVGGATLSDGQTPLDRPAHRRRRRARAAGVSGASSQPPYAS